MADDYNHYHAGPHYNIKHKHKYIDPEHDHYIDNYYHIDYFGPVNDDLHDHAAIVCECGPDRCWCASRVVDPG
jgi:hypothetical protein